MKRRFTGALVAGLLLAWPGTVGRLHAQGTTLDQSQAKRVSNIETTDYLVPHISTVPTNSGKWVELFVREKVESRRRGKAPVVLMIAGTTVSAVPDFDLQFENYSWMEYLAAAGFDVFTMDLTGYGLSPRPMMDDPCNNSTPTSRRISCRSRSHTRARPPTRSNLVRSNRISTRLTGSWSTSVRFEVSIR
jgi:hypothetical protein